MSEKYLLTFQLGFKDYSCNIEQIKGLLHTSSGYVIITVFFHWQTSALSKTLTKELQNHSTLFLHQVLAHTQRNTQLKPYLKSYDIQCIMTVGAFKPFNNFWNIYIGLAPEFGMIFEKSDPNDPMFVLWAAKRLLNALP